MTGWVRRAAAAIGGAVLIVLAVIVVLQARQIDGLRADADRDRASASRAASGVDERLAGLDARVAAAERRDAGIFDPQAVAASVLPSVFQVIADDYTGSAFAIGRTADGRANVLTAYHVVEQVWARGGTSVRLDQDDKRYTAVIADVDQEQDLALLTVDTGFTGLSAAAGPPAAGENVLVVGAPLGLAQSITTGVVSAVRERTDGPGTMIQFDASINPGNSGGPVINTRKQVVGIADAKARDAEGIGLAVPIQAACKSFHVC